MNANIEIPKGEIAAFCQRHRIRRMALFGSVLRDDFGPESDVDVLVAFEPDVRLGWDFFSVAEELSQILGRKADMHTFESVANKQNWLLREEILGSAEAVYERGPGYESWPQEGRDEPLKTGGKRRDDRVPLLDMLIHAREAVDLFSGISRADLEEDRIKGISTHTRSGSDRRSGQPSLAAGRRNATQKCRGAKSSEHAMWWRTTMTKWTSTSSAILCGTICRRSSVSWKPLLEKRSSPCCVARRKRTPCLPPSGALRSGLKPRLGSRCAALETLARHSRASGNPVGGA